MYICESSWTIFFTVLGSCSFVIDFFLFKYMNTYTARMIESEPTTPTEHIPLFTA